MEWLVPVFVALIGGPLMWFLHRFDRRNTQQHDNNMTTLQRIEKKVDHVGERVDDHIHWHLGKNHK